jgi:hypothetical protein
MSDDRPQPEKGSEDTFRLRWPPSPKTQIILIAIGFGLLNLILIIILAIALYIGR